MLATEKNDRHREIEQVSRQLVRALRGRRSCAETSRRLGYKSNSVRRWEAGHSWPTAARFIKAYYVLNPEAPNCFARYFRRKPPWLTKKHDLTQQVASFLRDLNGKTPIVTLARTAGFNRYSTSRWLSGEAEPPLPVFLALVDAATDRLPDLVATMVDPSRLPSLAKAWQRLQLARQAAYREPWSHAVLRALELSELPKGRSRQLVWIAKRLGLPTDDVRRCLRILEETGQARLVRGSYRRGESLSIDTSSDEERGPALKAAWARTAIERMEAGAKGNFGYSLFAVSHADMVKIRELHFDYVRAMQRIIAESHEPQSVGLYSVQLLDLGQPS